jgi:hypothetical protein
MTSDLADLADLLAEHPSAAGVLVISLLLMVVLVLDSLR